MNTINEVTTFAVRQKPRKVVFSDGTELTVGRLPWTEFGATLQAVSGGIVGIIAAAELANATGRDTVSVLAEKLADLPQAVMLLVAYTTMPVSDDINNPFKFLEDHLLAVSRWDYADVLDVATVAIEVNFSNTESVRSFFSAGRALVEREALLAGERPKGETAIREEAEATSPPKSRSARPSSAARPRSR